MKVRTWLYSVSILAVSTLGLAPSVHSSASKSFSLKGGSFKIAVPSGWEEMEDFFGMPLVILGPETDDGNRSVVSIAPSDLKGFTFDQKKIAQDEKFYQKGREVWADDMSGRVLSFEPYQVKQLAPELQAHTIGHSFRLGEADFSEKSYYISCKGQFYYLKTLHRLRADKDDSELLAEIAGSFRCS